MKNFYKLLIAIFILCFEYFTVAAQDYDQNKTTIKEAEILRSQGKVNEAMAKLNEVLKSYPDDALANYNMGYTLYATKKGLEAIPYLEKVLKSTHPGLVVSAYNMMGSIYDTDHQPQKAIAAYNLGIKIGPTFRQIHYNLGLAYFRNNQYAEAEAEAIEAMKQDTKNALNQRLYALVCFHQNKRGNALLGFCGFLLADDQGTHTVEALSNIESILKGGVLKEPNGKTAALVESADAEVAALNNAITATAATAQLKKLTGAALLEFELNSIINTAGRLAEKNTNKTFFDKFFAGYLYKLLQSGNLLAFVHIVSVSIYKDEDTKWLNDNPGKVAALKSWVEKTERGF